MATLSSNNFVLLGLRACVPFVHLDPEIVQTVTFYNVQISTPMSMINVNSTTATVRILKFTMIYLKRMGTFIWEFR